MKPEAAFYEDETSMPLRAAAGLLALDVLSSSAAALPGHNHLEPVDSGLKALTMIVIAAIAYARPVEYGAQLLERRRYLWGLCWLTLCLGAPFMLLGLLNKLTPQVGLVATLICAIVANIITKVIAPPKLLRPRSRHQPSSHRNGINRSYKQKQGPNAAKGYGDFHDH